MRVTVPKHKVGSDKGGQPVSAFSFHVCMQNTHTNIHTAKRNKRKRELSNGRKLIVLSRKDKNKGNTFDMPSRNFININLLSALLPSLC